MNLHHLELFYYVARHRGISPAARRMPYGIQQPAISEQILQLEDQLRVRLFERTPFRLTSEGEELFAVLEPFFAQLDEIEMRFRAGPAPHLHLGAAEPVLRDHLPQVLRVLRRSHPRLRISLRSGYQPQLESWLLERQIDLAITALDTRPLPTLRCQPLLRLPLVLLVPRRSTLRDAETLFRRPRLLEPLISSPATETISRNFQNGLERRGLAWSPSIVASSLETIARYVADGYGIGVTLAETARHPRVRALPLGEGFEPVVIAALSPSRPKPIVEAALAAILAYVRQTWPAARRLEPR